MKDEGYAFFPLDISENRFNGLFKYLSLLSLRFAGYVLFNDVHDMPWFKFVYSRFDEPFEDVVYPKDDPDAVLISERDVKLLEPDTFINDTIIDFYIKWVSV